jgi:hypothetical protein
MRARSILALALLMPFVALAAEDPALDSKAQQKAPTAFADDKPKPVAGWGEGEGRSYWVPALDIVLFDVLLNRYNYYLTDLPEDYDVTSSSFEANRTGAWVYDSDPFDINQFGHPFQGSMYHGFARSAGLGYWTASLYTLLGSTAWEVAGEVTPPSVNDEFTTGLGGSFLGEPLFRMASLLLESGDHTSGFWRELGAAALSPSTGYNRLVYGDRFDGVFRSHNPAAYTRIAIGSNFDSSVSSNVTDPNGVVVPQSYETGASVADFTIGYGLPGKPGYTYARPFDYFHFQFSASSSNVLENVMTRGLLYGTDYAWGDSYRGIWGLYGTYDYIAPQIFRISSTAVALGTTSQAWLSRKLALQGSVLAGVGYGSAGTIEGLGEKDYHHGLTPQALVALRLIHSDRTSLDFTGRSFHVTDTASDESGGRERIVRGDATLTVRVWNLHGLTLKYVASRRDASYPELGDTRQKVGAISVGYAYLGQTRSGAVDWRPQMDAAP